MKVSPEKLPRVRQIEHELWHLRALDRWSKHRQLELIGRRAPAWMINRYTEDREYLHAQIVRREIERESLIGDEVADDGYDAF